MKRSLHLGFAALILLTSAAMAPDADAQFWGQDPKKKKRPPDPRPKQTFHTVSLTSPPTLPYFPSWTGYKPLFLDGHSYPNIAPLECYTCAWAYKEPAGTVMKWYAEALPGAGWVINTSISRENVVVARHAKEPYEIQFQVSPAATPGYRCTAEVRFTKNPKWSKYKR